MRGHDVLESCMKFTDDEKADAVQWSRKSA